MHIAILPGDGIGPEVINQALKVLDVFKNEGEIITYAQGLIGGVAYDRTGTPLPQDTIDLLKSSQAILFGAEGGFQYESLPRGLRPGDALLKVRRDFNLFANLRPVTVYDDLLNVSPLKRRVIQGTDLMIIRELTGGIYFGEPRSIETIGGERVGVNTLKYRESEIQRIANFAFATAQKRRKHVCSVDKANVLESMELWRDVVDDVALQYPDVTLEHIYVDAAAMQLVRDPSRFDVILTTNLFGDILSDEASVISGSIGLLPSASVGPYQQGLYEPIHGCAPDLAGKNVANPIGAILSVGMMMDISFARADLRSRVARAVKQVLQDGYRTMDLADPRRRIVTTSEMGDAVADALRATYVDFDIG